MSNNNQNFQYLLRLYTIVDEYLADVPVKQETLPDIIVSFCIVLEKLLKIKLYEINSVLVFDYAKFKEDDALITVIKKEELSIETIRIKETINRYKLLFNDDFSDDEIVILMDIYHTRNHFIHGYKADDDILTDRETLVKKMGTVWETISSIAVAIFGKESIKASKPKKKYTEEELESILIEEVKKKIGFTEIRIARSLTSSRPNEDFLAIFHNGIKCPRCEAYEFSIENTDSSDPLLRGTGYPNMSDLYKCKKCHLELTRKEYELAKKIKSPQIYYP